MPCPANQDAYTSERRSLTGWVTCRHHVEPRPRSFINEATTATAESELRSSDLITFSRSALVRFWLSLNFASTRVALISKPTMCCNIRLWYCSLREVHCAA